jgi:hypothetical protein
VIGTGGAGVTGAVVAGTTFRLPAVAAVVLVVVGLTAGAAPAIAISLTRVRVPQPRGDLDPAAAGPQPGVGAEDVRAGVGLGREILLGLSAATALLLAMSAPLLPRLGVSGTLLGVVAAALIMLRTRRTRALVDVSLGLAGGLVGLVLVAGAAALVHPGWRTVLAVVALGTGVVLLLASAAPGPRRLWVGRLADVAEVVVLVVLLPLLVLAIGLVAAVRT